MACLGIIKEFIKRIPGVKTIELDLESGEIIIDYEGELNREELGKIIKEKTGYKVS